MGEKCIVDNPFLVVVGYYVYLVGGCVRDLILMQTPKDFDIITSADLREVTLISYFDLIFKLFVDNLTW
jgi:tRNA nucleotidyltransferase/poly(A) polymerase